MNKNILKPFSIEEARNGATVVTRDGRRVKIIYDELIYPRYRIVALVDHDGNEHPHIFTINGKFLSEQEHELDLFIQKKEVVKWAPIFKTRDGVFSGMLCDSESDANDSVLEAQRREYLIGVYPITIHE